MFNNSDIYNNKDEFSRIMLGNPYTKEGRDVLSGLGVNMSIEDIFKNHDLYVEPFFAYNTEANAELSTLKA